jgi:hypothetical protein
MSPGFRVMAGLSHCPKVRLAAVLDSSPTRLLCALRTNADELSLSETLTSLKVKVIITSLSFRKNRHAKIAAGARPWVLSL